MNELTGRDSARFRRRAVWLGAGALLAAMVLLAILNSKITVYSDDYWYGTFFDNGLRGFVRNMFEHYKSTNGRFYVHVIIPIVLLFDTKLFIFLSPVLLAALYWFGAKMLNDRLPVSSALLAAALGVFCTMACDVQYLRMTLLWISAYFNYVFPVCMTALAAYCQKRWYDGKQSKTGHVFGLIFALLAGASTEQCGIVSLVVVWGYAILSRIFAKTPRKRCWGYPIFVLLGFLTILAAPGSWARVDRGVDGGILSCLHPTVFMARFFDAMHYVVKYPSTVVLLSGVYLLSGAACLADKRLSKGLLLGVLMAVGQVAFYVCGLEKLACIWAILSLLALTVLFLLQKDYWMTGLMLLAAVAANMMLIITTLNSERTAFAGIVALIIVAVSLLLRVLEKLPRWIGFAVPAVVTALCVCAYVPTLQGYTASKKIVDENLASVEQSRESGVCYLNIDIDPRYRFTMPFEGSYFYNEFRAYYHIDENTQLVFTSEKWRLASLASQSDTCVFPTLQDDTDLYFPVEYAVSAAGGSAEYSWKNHAYTVTFGKKTYLITKDGALYIYNPDGSKTLLGSDFTLLLPFSETYTLLYCPAEQLAEYFGVRYSYDTDANLYTVQ